MKLYWKKYSNGSRYSVHILLSEDCYKFEAFKPISRDLNSNAFEGYRAELAVIDALSTASTHLRMPWCL